MVEESRFVILHHTGWVAGGRGDHWDWLIEWPEPNQRVAEDSKVGLLTFAASIDPRAGWCESPLQRLAPHRRQYLEYEGSVSGNRGQVHRVATGRLVWGDRSPHALAFRLLGIEFLEPPTSGGPSIAWPLAPYFLTHRDCVVPHGEVRGDSPVDPGSPPARPEFRPRPWLPWPEAMGDAQPEWLLRTSLAPFPRGSTETLPS